MSDKHIDFQIYDYIDSHEYDDSSETPDDCEIGNYTIHLLEEQLMIKMYMLKF